MRAGYEYKHNNRIFAVGRLGYNGGIIGAIRCESYYIERNVRRENARLIGFCYCNYEVQKKLYLKNQFA